MKHDDEDNAAEREAIEATARPTTDGGGNWEKPTSFDAVTLPPFPLDALPSWLAEHAATVATALQVPVDLPALLGLAVVALALAKKREAVVRPGWTEPVNLYVIVSLPPGEGKSPAFRKALDPVWEWEAEAREKAAPAIAAQAEERQLADERLKQLRRTATSAKPADRREAEQRAKEAAIELSEIVVPLPPRLIADDATPEALALMLGEQGGRLGVFSAEGAGPLDIAAGRYSEKGANMEVFLKGHSGDALTVDRVGRPPSRVARPALTLALTVQPSVIAGLATKPGFRGRGLLARFFYSVPRSLVGTRDMDPPPISEAACDTYARHVRSLLDLEADTHNGEHVARGLPFTDGALEALVAYRAEHEARLGDAGDLQWMADWVTKLGGLVARLAVLLAVADDASADRIERRHAVAAIVLGRYALAHALAAFSRMGGDPALDDARHVLAWLRRERLTAVTRRDVHRAHQSRFPRVEALDPVLRLLVERGYLREQAPKHPSVGRPSAGYDVNPLTEVTLCGSVLSLLSRARRFSCSAPRYVRRSQARARA